MISVKFTGPLLGLCVFAATTQAAIMNGDFSNDFEHWSAQVATCIVCDGSDDVVIDISNPPDEFTTNFDASSHAALLTINDFDHVFSVSLFQTFTMPTADALVLSMDLAINLSDPLLDLAFAQLMALDGELLLDLSVSDEFDVSAYAGEDVEILFGITDFDLSLDTLTVDNIVITPSVSIPNVLSLLACGLIVLYATRMQS